jgi:hypothetical protein
MYSVQRKAAFCPEEYEFGVKVEKEDNSKGLITRIEYAIIPKRRCTGKRSRCTV